MQTHISYQSNAKGFKSAIEMIAIQINYINLIGEQRVEHLRFTLFEYFRFVPKFYN